MYRILSPKLLQSTLSRVCRHTMATTTTAAAQGSSTLINEILKVDQLSPNTFRSSGAAHTPHLHHEGDIVGQMLLAASTYQTPGYELNSVHCTVVNTALSGEDVTFDVESLKQGRSLANQMIYAHQNDRVCLRALVSSHQPEPEVLKYNIGIPNINPPDQCNPVYISDLLRWSRGLSQKEGNELKKSKFWQGLKMRVDPNVDNITEYSNPWIWFKWEEPIGEDINHHVCVVAYTINLLLTANSGSVENTDHTHRTVFNMSMWFQDKLSVNNWLLAQLSPQVINGDESLHRLTVWREDGHLVVSGYIDGLSKQSMFEFRTTQARL